jgi:(2Fe-2S) ferredoxin/signal-transduction protein with cAMP-binding, CBS, and nucleotidyltransferase domain
MACLELLKRVDPFSSLNDDALSVISSFCTLKKYKYAHRLFKDGDSASYLWVVGSGLIDLRFDLPDSHTSEESTLSSVAENKIIGWSSLVPPYRYRLSAYCASDECTVLMIERDLLFGFMKDNPEAGYKILSAILKVVGNRFERLRETADEAPFSSVKVIVHMGTCGIAAGARSIMKALIEEIARTGNSRIKVSAGGCIGRCASEPNVTVEIRNEKPVIYQKMDPAKMIRVFNEHLISGRVQKDLAIEGGKS